MFVGRVLDHWRTGTGSKYIPKRKTALGMVQLSETLQDVLREENWPVKPLVVATSARPHPRLETIGFKDLREIIQTQPQRPVLLVFVTGFGLHENVLSQCQVLLEPIKGDSKDDYRHLAVRSAVSICLDRLLGTW